MQIGDNLHEMLNPVFWENYKNISKCCLLKSLPKVLSVKVLITTLADFILIFFSFFYVFLKFSEQTKLVISCQSEKMIHENAKSYLLWKIMKKKNNNQKQKDK